MSQPPSSFPPRRAPMAIFLLLACLLALGILGFSVIVLQGVDAPLRQVQKTLPDERFSR